MRAVLQRVSRAQVRVGGQVVGAIGAGVLALIGVERGDGPEDLRFMADKIAGLRIFADAHGKMNLSLREIGGRVLAVSQFTLLADCRKGMRPSFDRAESPEKAAQLYDALVEALRARGCSVETGQFRAHMAVELDNDGPVTVLLDSKNAQAGPSAPIKRG